MPTIKRVNLWIISGISSLKMGLVGPHFVSPRFQDFLLKFIVKFVIFKLLYCCGFQKVDSGFFFANLQKWIVENSTFLDYTWKIDPNTSSKSFSNQRLFFSLLGHSVFTFSFLSINTI